MNTKESRQSNDLRETAQKMIRCMGVKDALACCMSNQWVGLLQELQILSESHVARR
jgi:hypothetical protein